MTSVDSASDVSLPRAFRFLPWALFAVVFILFASTLSFDFLDWDDMVNIVHNHHLARLGKADFRWFLTSSAVSDFKPLVWLSYVADRLVWGLRPAGFRLTNILLHAANAVWVYVLGVQLLGLSGGVGGRARLYRVVACVAALLFALHPQRIESVVWISERKDVLHAFFYLAALSLYVKGPGANRLRWVVRWTVLGMAAMLSKSMAVTLPVVLLLADGLLGNRLPVWRNGGVLWRKALMEKAPLLLAAVLTGLRALQDQSDNPAGNFMLLGTLWSYASAVGYYAAKTLWPEALCPLYAAHGLVPAAEARALLMGGIAMLLLAGWLWQRGRRLPVFLMAFFVVALGPALPIRFVADRYTYLPSLGLIGCIVGLWMEGMVRAERQPVARVVLWLAALLALVGSGVSALRYAPVWQDSLSLWTHVVKANPCARSWYGLGAAQLRLGDFAAASASLDEALRCDAEFVGAYSMLGEVRLREGNAVEAERYLRRALELNPRMLEAHQNMGTALAMQDRLDEAIAAWQRAVELDSENFSARLNLSRAYLKVNRPRDALDQGVLALRIRPASSEAADAVRRAEMKLSQ